jgi:hypothetical protein
MTSMRLHIHFQACSKIIFSQIDFCGMCHYIVIVIFFPVNLELQFSNTENFVGEIF